MLFLPRQSGGGCPCAQATALAWRGYQALFGDGCGACPSTPAAGSSLGPGPVRAFAEDAGLYGFALPPPLEPELGVMPPQQFANATPCRAMWQKEEAVGHGNHPAAGFGRGSAMGLPVGTGYCGRGGWHELGCQPGG